MLDHAFQRRREIERMLLAGKKLTVAELMGRYCVGRKSISRDFEVIGRELPVISKQGYNGGYFLMDGVGKTRIRSRRNNWNACNVHMLEFFEGSPVKIVTLDCEAGGINRDTIVNPASMGFVSAATNLIITGATGAGKTYLSCVLGVEACKQTLRACYIRIPDMPGHFQNHKDNLREQARYRKRNKTRLIDTKGKNRILVKPQK